MPTARMEGHKSLGLLEDMCFGQAQLRRIDCLLWTECGDSSCNWLTYCLILVRYQSQLVSTSSPQWNHRAYCQGEKLPLEWPWHYGQGQPCWSIYRSCKLNACSQADRLQPSWQDRPRAWGFVMATSHPCILLKWIFLLIHHGMVDTPCKSILLLRLIDLTAGLVHLNSELRVCSRSERVQLSWQGALGWNCCSQTDSLQLNWVLKLQLPWHIAAELTSCSQADKLQRSLLHCSCAFKIELIACSWADRWQPSWKRHAYCSWHFRFHKN